MTSHKILLTCGLSDCSVNWYIHLHARFTYIHKVFHSMLFTKRGSRFWDFFRRNTKGEKVFQREGNQSRRKQRWRYVRKDQ